MHVKEPRIVSSNSEIYVNYWSYILHLSNTLEKWEYNEVVHQLFIDFKKAYDSFRREVLHNILIETGIATKLVRLIKICS